MLARSNLAAEKACNGRFARPTRTVVLLPTQSILVDQRSPGHWERPLLTAKQVACERVTVQSSLLSHGETGTGVKEEMSPLGTSFGTVKH